MAGRQAATLRESRSRAKKSWLLSAPRLLLLVIHERSDADTQSSSLSLAGSLGWYYPETRCRPSSPREFNATSRSTMHAVPRGKTKNKPESKFVSRQFVALIHQTLYYTARQVDRRENRWLYYTCYIRENLVGKHRRGKCDFSPSARCIYTIEDGKNDTKGMKGPAPRSMSLIIHLSCFPGAHV